MLEKANLEPIPRKERILAIVTISALIVVGSGMVLFSHDGVRAQNRKPKPPEPQIIVTGGVPGDLPGGVAGVVPGGVPGGEPGGVSGGVPGVSIEKNRVDPGANTDMPQDRQSIEQQLEQAPINYLKYENSADSPFTVTDSKIRFVKIEQPGQNASGVQAGRSSVYYQPTVTLLNRTPKRITGLAVKVKRENGGQNKFSETIIQNSAVSLGPGEAFKYSTIYYRSDEENPALFVDRLVLEVYGALFEDGTSWGSISVDRQFTFDYPERATEAMTSSLRPKILYKEKASYTKEARDQGIEGVVILNVVFRSDGKVSDIKTVRGLAGGLTEKAIEAAQKIRFEPAMKDGVPVNVRGKLEFSFSLGKRDQPNK